MFQEEKGKKEKEERRGRGKEQISLKITNDNSTMSNTLVRAYLTYLDFVYRIWLLQG